MVIYYQSQEVRLACMPLQSKFRDGGNRHTPPLFEMELLSTVIKETHRIFYFPLDHVSVERLKLFWLVLISSFNQYKREGGTLLFTLIRFPTSGADHVDRWISYHVQQWLLSRLDCIPWSTWGIIQLEHESGPSIDSFISWWLSKTLYRCCFSISFLCNIICSL